MDTNKIYKSDIEIAQQATLLPIKHVAEKFLNLQEEELELYGKYKAKLSLTLLDRLKNKKPGQVILVTSINPTSAGEGKSTVTVGLGQALNQLNKKAIIAMREPSLGPTMGLKGGATGGGFSQVLPMDEINLHFTGDLHAITTANNALASFIDNHIYQGNKLRIDPRRIVWKRVLDLNDRSLRNITIGLGGPMNGVPREDHFDITVASEIMAILCLAESLSDLRTRLSKIVIGYTYENTPITVGELGYEGALTLLLKDAIKPNLVQTIEHTPAIIHGGPFANIAHGCNSLLATKMASKLGDYVVTEAGFGADLGAEKFLNIKARIGKISPAAVVIVATIRALKLHGGIKKENLLQENTTALMNGIANLNKHIETIKGFGLPYVVAINKFITDTDDEINAVIDWCDKEAHPQALCEVWEHGGKGGIDLANKVLSIIDSKENHFHQLYDQNESIKEKIMSIASKVYGATGVQYTSIAERQIKEFEQLGWSELPICMAKTQYSLTDQAHLVGRPENFTLTIREFKISLGAGFIVALTGNIMTMPGLPKKPAALAMDVNEAGFATGLF
ncbi:formate--tetrahydrofolate ligase [Metabacillus sediminilitoris]|uniref:Formate--tetrahydrofolate ligase n=1 Tax=Metabacillus sediminilitoris TaxID=2567941 RepID=A0A4S4BMX7_9BACI|nr:formate--tetrahydrofolate ligase [Metabacillus sediminilitoris]QGQ46600.1 formate--tetrahydrofolate ligase [Metabacillus sediminilitoris]THF75997.1 formate--tetrahydrofolate ligase [Metabacillus sediminilitoris]